MLGKLDAVGSLSAKFVGNFSLLAIWEAPFSLNLTNTESDITYDVHITLDTDGQLEYSQFLNLDETTFLYTLQYHDHCDSQLHNTIFNITVVPVNGVGQGIPKWTQIQCKYIYTLAQHYYTYFVIQWSPSITDTTGTKDSVLYILYIYIYI